MKLSELYEQRIEEGILDKIKSFFKGKESKNEDIKLQDLTDEEREMINKVMPHNNSDVVYSPGKYVLPKNITAYSGKGRINFYNNRGQLTAGVGYYSSGSDAQNMKVSPIAHFDEKISSIEDLKKLKDMLK
jgi:hypothetical protein